MSVTGSSYNINAINKLSEEDLKRGSVGRESWHHRYRESCYIFVGELHQGLTEGDLIIVFSEWGEPIDINLIRDKKTGKSRGFAFIGYENQLSTNLAVDNANGITLVGRRLRVDHVLNYRPPRDDEEAEDFKPKPNLLD